MTAIKDDMAIGKPARRPWFRRGDTENLAPWQLITFALPSVPLAVLLLPAAVLLPPFYTGEMGISLTTWALIITLSRIWDVITDPFVGILSDRIPSRWGRRRHLLVVAAPLTMLGFALLFMPGLFVKHVTPVFVLVAMIVSHLGATIIGLNHAAWGAELSSDYHERTRIMGWRGGVAALAPVVAFAIPGIMERLHPGAPAADRIAAMGWVSLILLPVAIAAAIFSTDEKPPAAVAHDKAPKLLASLKMLATNRVLHRMLLANVLSAFPTSVSTSLFVFSVTFVLHVKGIASGLFVVALGASMISVPFWMWVAKGREKHHIVAVGYLFMGLVELGYLFLRPGDLFPFIAILFLIGFSGGAGFLQTSIMADIVDSDTAVSGREQAGVFFAIMETVAKLAPTLALIIIFPLLQTLGFDPTGAHNTAGSINVVKYCFALGPTIPAWGIALVMWRFPLGSKEQAELRAKIEADRQ